MNFQLGEKDRRTGRILLIYVLIASVMPFMFTSESVIFSEAVSDYLLLSAMAIVFSMWLFTPHLDNILNRFGGFMDGNRDSNAYMTSIASGLVVSIGIAKILVGEIKGAYISGSVFVFSVFSMVLFMAIVKKFGMRREVFDFLENWQRVRNHFSDHLKSRFYLRLTAILVLFMSIATASLFAFPETVSKLVISDSQSGLLKWMPLFYMAIWLSFPSLRLFVNHKASRSLLEEVAVFMSFAYGVSLVVYLDGFGILNLSVTDPLTYLFGFIGGLTFAVILARVGAKRSLKSFFEIS